MSRYPITVSRDGDSDPEAVIGYDPPLRTFFLQAFPDESGDNLALWIGTEHHEFPTLETLREATEARGYTFPPLPAELLAKLLAEVAIGSTRPEPTGPLADFAAHLRKS
jgi:hypothetical protein